MILVFLTQCRLSHPFFLYLFPPPIYVWVIQMDTLSCSVLFFAMFHDYYDFAIKTRHALCNHGLREAKKFGNLGTELWMDTV